MEEERRNCERGESEDDVKSTPLTRESMTRDQRQQLHPAHNRHHHCSRHLRIFTVNVTLSSAVSSARTHTHTHTRTHVAHNTQNDCHQWLSRGFIECTKFVFGRGFAPESAGSLQRSPRLPSWFKGTLLITGRGGESRGSAPVLSSLYIPSRPYPYGPLNPAQESVRSPLIPQKS